MITLATTNKRVSTSEELLLANDWDASKKAARMAFHRLEHAFETLALGLDISQDGKSIGVQIRFACTDASLADAIADDIRLLVELAREQVSVETQTQTQTGSENQLVDQMTRQLIERIAIAPSNYNDGGFEVVVRSAVDNPPGLGQMLIQQILADTSDVSVTASGVTATEK